MDSAKSLCLQFQTDHFLCSHLSCIYQCRAARWVAINRIILHACIIFILSLVRYIGTMHCIWRQQRLMPACMNGCIQYKICCSRLLLYCRMMQWCVHAWHISHACNITQFCCVLFPCISRMRISAGRAHSHCQPVPSNRRHHSRGFLP